MVVVDSVFICRPSCPDFPQDIRHQCLWFGPLNCTVLECVSDSAPVLLVQPLPRNVDKNVDVKLAMSRHELVGKIARMTASSET